jgi:UDP-glucose 4-epimerase
MVTGGAGYIGSVICVRLLEAGHQVTAYDDLSRGHRAAVAPDAELVVGDVRDTERLTAELRERGCTAIVHMAALAEVGESVVRPDLYRDVNTAGTESLARAAAAAGVERIVFSSTAAVYGQPDEMPITEGAAAAPTNPYGQTKLAAELVLFAPHAPFSVAALRYFNACGAYGACGEDHRPETHLLPLALRAARDGSTLAVFGDDYPTPDGTCVRDYVHVADLADAHISALERLPGCAGACNLGTARGHSVTEVLDAVQTVTGRPVARRAEARRAGDPPTLVADNRRAATLLGWQSRRGLLDAARDAWDWMQAYPGGYED